MGGHDVATLKLLGSFLSHIKEKSVLKACRADHDSLSMLGRILQHNDVAVSLSVATEGGPADNKNLCKLWKVYCP